MFEKNAVLEGLDNSPKNVFSGVPVLQLKLSNLPPITVLKTDPAPNVS